MLRFVCLLCSNFNPSTQLPVITMTEAYITILINDNYLPGSLVLARSLRDLGTTKKLAILVANVSNEAIELLKQVYDDVIPVNPILSTSFDELSTLGRIDLVSTFTKILVWSQHQYSKIIYLDSDVLPIVNIDEFFNELQNDDLIAASPDSGWPDIFNSGVFITKPSETIFNDLFHLIQNDDKASFDGADQGLLNEYFLGKWKRLPFTFNVTPSAGYQYVPAFTRFAKDIKIIHFIGLNKPWLTRDSNSFASTSFGKGYEIITNIHKNWWKVFNSHYFGKIAGDIFKISNIKPIEDYSNKGEAHLLALPNSIINQWDNLDLNEDEDEGDGFEYQAPPPIFPWEQASNRAEATRVFDEETDFYVD